MSFRCEDGFVAVAPWGAIMPDTVSKFAGTVREIIGESKNPENHEEGWRRARQQGWKVRRCSIKADLKAHDV